MSAQFVAQTQDSMAGWKKTYLLPDNSPVRGLAREVLVMPSHPDCHAAPVKRFGQFTSANILIYVILQVSSSIVQLCHNWSPVEQGILVHLDLAQSSSTIQTYCQIGYLKYFPDSRKSICLALTGALFITMRQNCCATLATFCLFTFLPNTTVVHPTQHSSPNPTRLMQFNDTCQSIPTFLDILGIHQTPIHTWSNLRRTKCGNESSEKAGFQASSQDEREAVRTFSDKTRSSSTYFRIRLLHTIWMLEMTLLIRPWM